MIQKQEDQVHQAENYYASVSGWPLPCHPHTMHVHTRLHSALMLEWTLQQFYVKQMRSTREYLLLEKLYYARNLISTQDTLNILYLYAYICIPLDFRLPRPPTAPLQERLFHLGNNSVSSAKKGSHTFSFYYQWRSAAVKSELSRIHTFSLIKI